ncbi:permease prefix domain 1-containing protein [Isachenkonia alkalipeptolytica]|uniref:Uncharacterized protein n=1 Tax=Isachenkonia alkalipeptolytica TaxID=2565777 RepID=A0AA43XL73_9CLOT|nr:permease prefix domain 1-containing protein [Isachenkonia alkalipeptolytica]NBG88426.1 hypothetical protein [Isachenkonia alkalipeptolytica]
MQTKDPEINDFIKELLREIRFFPAKKEIEQEYSDHLEDKIRDLIIEERMTREEALFITLEEMGDPREIGKALNEVHNPFLGWALLVSRGLLIVFGAFALHLLISFSSELLFHSTRDIGIEEDLVISEIPIDREIEMDATTYYFDRAVIQNNGEAFILIETLSYTRPPRIRGLFFTSVQDNLGNTYYDLTIPYRSRIFRKDLVLPLKNIAEEAEFLTLEFDRYNRAFEINLPLPERRDPYE